MWSSITFSYSVRLSSSDSQMDANPLVSLAASPERVSAVDQDKVDTQIGKIADSINILRELKEAMICAQASYLETCSMTRELKVRLGEESAAHLNQMCDRLWLLSRDESDPASATSLLPYSVLASSRGFPAEVGELGAPELAAYCLKYYQETLYDKSTQWRNGNQYVFQDESAEQFNSPQPSPNSSRNDLLSQRSDSFTPRGIGSSSSRGSVEVEPYSFSAEGIVVPAGGDFRLPISVSQVCLVSYVRMTHQVCKFNIML